MGVPRHTHTREDESYFVLAGELEVVVGGKTFILKPGDSLVAPRGIHHQLRNSGDVENHYLLIFWPSGFESFLEATAVPAPDNAVAPTELPAAAIRNVHELAGEYGILFGWVVAKAILTDLFFLNGTIANRVSDAAASVIPRISTKNLLPVLVTTLAFALLEDHC
jgi:hypothetical protein